jgi:hypothetical protein
VALCTTPPTLEKEPRKKGGGLGGFPSYFFSSLLPSHTHGNDRRSTQESAEQRGRRKLCWRGCGRPRTSHGRDSHPPRHGTHDADDGARHVGHGVGGYVTLIHGAEGVRRREVLNVVLAEPDRRSMRR